jgi:hypothetical protein
MRARFTAAALTAIVAIAVLGTSAAGQRGAAAGACNRDCLTNISEQYITALVAKDPSKAPLAQTVRWTDNGQELPIGQDGFWNSVSGRGTYTLHIADPVLGSIVTFATMREGEQLKKAVLMAQRLKVVNGRITEVEDIIGRGDQESAGASRLDGLPPAARAGGPGRAGAPPAAPPAAPAAPLAPMKPRDAFMRATPQADRMSRQDLVKTANMYFSGMQLNDGKGKYPFADDCNRLENGSPTTNAPGQKPDPKTANNYSATWSCREQFESGLLHFVSRIRDRRYVAVDEERGVVVAFAFFDHDAGKNRHFTTPDGRSIVGGPQEPYTWEIAEAFKVEKGLLHEIEAVLTRAPYGMGSGWSNRADAMSDRIQFEK